MIQTLPPILGAPGTGKRTVARRLLAAGRQLGDPVQSKQLLVVMDWRAGLTESTRQTLALIAPLIEPRVIVAVNKLDLAGFEYEVFKATRSSLYRALAELPLHSVQIVPISAKHGDMVAARGTSIDWYFGPTLADLVTTEHADLTALAA